MWWKLTGSTSPLSVISPVMATSDLTNWPLNSEARQVTMVTPAEGPSLVTAPAGKWRWMSVPSSGSGLPTTVQTHANAECKRRFTSLFYNNVLHTVKALDPWELTVGELVGFSVRSEPADGQMCRLFHNVSQLTSQSELTISLHSTRLHKHDLSTEGSPGQAQSHAGQGEALRHLPTHTIHTHTHLWSCI